MIGNVYRILALAAAIMLTAMPRAYAQQPALRADIVRVTDAGYPNAQAVVNIEETSGGQVRQLTPNDFSVTVAGKPARVVSADLASSQNAPLDVLVVIDTSGSMAGTPITLAKAAAKSFISQLAPIDRVAVIGFNDKVTLMQDYTTDRKAASDAIDSLAAGGNTALYEATSGAALKAAASTASRRAIVVLSDGADFGSTSGIKRDDAVAAASRAGVPFFTIGEGNDIDRDYLQQIASVSKGRYLEAPSPQRLTALYSDIARLLRSQYIVTFDASGVANAGEVPVAITVKAGDQTASATASYKPAVLPPASITIEGVQQGESVSAPRTITVKAQGPQAISRVTFRVDGVDVLELTAPPYVYSFDPRKFGAGNHTLTVTVDAPPKPVESSVSFASAPPKSGGGLPLIPVAGGAGVLVVVTAAAVFLVSRRRSRVTPPAVVQIAAMRAGAPNRALSVLEAEPGESGPAETIDEPMGVLISRAGSDLGKEYVVGGRPVSIGSGRRCAVRIDDRGLASEEARIWVHNGHLMLHRITSLSAIANEGVSGGWVILEPGDIFDMGPHRYEFRLLLEPQPERDTSDIPNVLRDPDIPRRPAPPASFSPASAEEPKKRAFELMPTSDIADPPDNVQDRAS